MGLITEEVEVGLTGSNIARYEDLGYEIPRYYNKKTNQLKVNRNTKIKVKTENLPKGSGVKVKVQCDYCNKIYEMEYRNYYCINHQGKIYCNHCAPTVLISGENSPFWKINKSNEERIIGRDYPEYHEFIKRVLIRDNYTCQCCGKKSTKNMVVHHLYGYASFPEYRVDQTQAITLCNNCHISFHSWHQQQYGFDNRGGCTRQQYEEFCGKVIGKLQKYNCLLPAIRQVYDYEDDKIYQSVKEYCNIHKTNDSRVYDCCNHKIRKVKHVNKNGEIKYREIRYNTVCGHHLLWYDEYLQMSREDLEKHLQNSISKTLVKVICITTGEIFNSMTEASLYYKIDSSNINACCKGKRNFTGKLNGVPLRWMYLSDFEKLSKEEREKILDVKESENYGHTIQRRRHI